MMLFRQHGRWLSERLKRSIGVAAAMLAQLVENVKRHIFKRFPRSDSCSNRPRSFQDEWATRLIAPAQVVELIECASESPLARAVFPACLGPDGNSIRRLARQCSANPSVRYLPAYTFAAILKMADPFSSRKRMGTASIAGSRRMPALHCLRRSVWRLRQKRCAPLNAQIEKLGSASV